MQFKKYFSHTIQISGEEISLNHCLVNVVPKKTSITKVEALAWCIQLLSRLKQKDIADHLTDYLMHILDIRHIPIGSYKSYSEKKVNIVNAYIFYLVGKDEADMNALAVLTKLLGGSSIFNGGDVMLITNSKHVKL